MDWLLDAVRDFVAWLVAGIVTALGTWIAWITTKIHGQAARIAMLERAVNEIPGRITELKDLIEQLRGEGRERSRTLYAHIDSVRKELKQDIKDGDQR